MAVREKKRVVKTFEQYSPKMSDIRPFFQNIEENIKKSLKVDIRPEILKIRRPQEYFKIRK